MSATGAVSGAAASSSQSQQPNTQPSKALSSGQQVAPINGTACDTATRAFLITGLVLGVLFTAACIVGLSMNGAGYSLSAIPFVGTDLAGQFGHLILSATAVGATILTSFCIYTLANAQNKEVEKHKAESFNRMQEELNKRREGDVTIEIYNPKTKQTEQKVFNGKQAYDMFDTRFAYKVRENDGKEHWATRERIENLLAKKDAEITKLKGAQPNPA